MSRSALGRASTLLWLTMALVCCSGVFLGRQFVVAVGQAQWWLSLKLLVFDGCVALLLYGNLAYQVARCAALRRWAGHAPAPWRALDIYYDIVPDRLVAVVPSYREDPLVVRQTLLSAAMLDYPHRRVVLLLDDPPNPVAVEDRVSLEQSRALPGEIERLLAPIRRRVEDEDRQFRLRSRAPLGLSDEVGRLQALWLEVADWLDRQAAAERLETPTDALFIDLTWSARATDCRRRAARLASGARPHDITRDYRRLAAMFRVTVDVFERKQYANLSHEPNKAMNINSYLGLLGCQMQVDWQEDEQVLHRAADRVDLDVPDADWVLTLDADSLLTSDYALRLLVDLARPENARVGVAQAPYSAVPDIEGAVERVAGATTDVMHLVHQGLGQCAAGYWVGANALLRVRALHDIAVRDPSDGEWIVRFIQDRTVIEDTESTIDLASLGWTVRNYPERLAYSATPADYGALLIQRRRWANGGLIILPKCVTHLWRKRAKPSEAFLRVHYLTSIAAVNLALLILLCVPFGNLDTPVLLPLTCVPYFVAYASDLRLCGYRRRDLLSVYALNLLLVPVNLGGVLTSLYQAVTRRRIPFGRTPKVANRTAAPARYVAATLLLLLVWTIGAGWDLASQRWTHGVLAGLNSLVLVVAITRFQGWRAAGEDLRGGLPRLPTPRREGHQQMPTARPTRRSSVAAVSSSSRLLSRSRR